MSETQRRLGAGAVNSRWSRLGAAGSSLRGVAVQRNRRSVQATIPSPA
jgi:hypothetical protein